MSAPDYALRQSRKFFLRQWGRPHMSAPDYALRQSRKFFLRQWGRPHMSREPCFYLLLLTRQRKPRPVIPIA
jgi:hypothetical protein